MKIKLHIQILIGFILGIIFGAIFSVNTGSFLLTAKNSEIEIKDWQQVKFVRGDSTLAVFNESSQSGIIRYFESLKKEKKTEGVKLNIVYPVSAEVYTYENISSIQKTSSIGADIKPIGEIFIRLLNMIAVPLVLASLIVGAASLHDVKHLAKLGGKLMALFLFTSVISVALAQVLTVVIQPGMHMTPEAKTRLVEAYRDEIKAPVQQEYKMDLVEFLVNIVPKNPFKGLAEGDFLQIVLFAILTGLVLCNIPKERAKPVIAFFEGITQAMIKLVEKVILMAPLAVFALISATVSEFGFSILGTLFWYALTCFIALALVGFVLYPALVKFLGKVSPIQYFLAQKQVMAVAFTTSSSSATLPVTIDVTENKLGVPNKIAAFVLPIGTTVNKDGTALYQAVAAIFIAQVYGFDLSLAQQFTIFITCVITGAATAPVAGAGLIMLVVVLNAVGLPVEGIALIVGVDRIINMCRSTVNVIGDTMASVVIAKSEGELGEIKVKD
ncbi:MAG TPA: dicarboxylate/amino acid:cation symporter [Ignavibacteria bacterium]|nr:dicarboxylate/amino acid:cation symporter [Bacteroidota bacterium]HRE10587.1 dicarboxylate/amino acid:cation symporter [Ignavibacteria bacterium]HRF64874.1 dicarboxylate/amino acid:cation symporter [Ignavibacteria bacterium]HRJ04746.1 dicarboxylate/amino acid:cation symporter [Ignavibacteria bacterium]